MMRFRSRTSLIGSAATSTTIATALAALIGAPALGAPRPAPAVAAIGIPDCLGTPHVRPVSITLACGDGGLIANGLSWTGWGNSFAAARGIASANDCTPNCAAGHYRTLPIVLIADGRERCPDGRPAYARLTVAWPAPTDGSAELDVSTPCGRP